MTARTMTTSMPLLRGGDVLYAGAAAGSLAVPMADAATPARVDSDAGATDAPVGSTPGLAGMRFASPAAGVAARMSRVESVGGEIGASTASPGRPEARAAGGASACVMAAITLVVAAG